MPPTSRPLRSITSPTSRRRRKAVAVVIALAASAASTTVAAATGDDSVPVDSSTPAASGYASAEDAVTAYLEAMSAGDLDGMLSTFAIDVYVEHFDFEASLDRLGFYLPHAAGLPLPPTDPLNIALDIEHRRAMVAGMVLNQYFALTDPELNDSNGQIVDDAASFTASLESVMTSTAVASLADGEFVPLDEIDAEASETLAGDRAQDVNAETLAVAGADASEELAVRVNVGDDEAILLFRTVRYGEGWWIETLGGQFALLLSIVEHLDAGVIRTSEESSATTEPGGTGATTATSTP